LAKQGKTHYLKKLKKHTIHTTKRKQMLDVAITEWKDRNQIDYIMFSKKWIGSLRNSRAFPQCRRWIGTSAGSS